ncbi:helix-turn-helix domain-containing protein [Candidatus Schmidhempelia bombi]|uniref:XRE family transcriptional regulator n=1 Tax=Candidatus Schmidhempelia bombi str. Bimp TaxID=1387197 RepID=A0AB94IEY3_9GAMM|nr:helix-turn-helix transcriptional regulator [Candidatus Schmidhempelia bombi]TEA28071.1 XRE family transcriptional regulator [Candidatus Schmidhempelia bombi str. Bimp]
MNHLQIDHFAIGQRLKAYRFAASLKAEDVAKHLKISRAAVYRLEKGEIIKIETLNRLANLLNTSLSSLLGIDTEYYSSSNGFFERMRQLEEQSTHIYAHFEPFSFLLMSPDYFDHLQMMLYETAEHNIKELEKIDAALVILKERKNDLSHSLSKVNNLIGLRSIERFLHIGLVGKLNLSPSKKMTRTLLAHKEIEYLIRLIEEKNTLFEIAITQEMVPSSTFQIFYNDDTPLSLAVSAFRLGELPNVTTGIASITSSVEAISHYQGLFDKLWTNGIKDGQAIDLLRSTLERC